MTAPVPVTVYSKPSCVQCTATKRHLDRKHITYEEDDATTDGNLAAILSLGHKAAPVVVIAPDGPGSELSWAEYRPDLIDALAENRIDDIRNALDRKAT
ncbi:glutaredoxin domain-containing protein [Microbacterium lacus]|uniref:glutaredoxin domain-containing protein n=1 Tax=Microbacterium lacus TaxID=415217 RepID=UPI000C2B75A1|nr:glutaredoxin domain-containing protein [Microbacterium lacus]